MLSRLPQGRTSRMVAVSVIGQKRRLAIMSDTRTQSPLMGPEPDEITRAYELDDLIGRLEEPTWPRPAGDRAPLPDDSPSRSR